MVNLLPTLARALSRGTTDTFPRYLLVLESYLLLDARRTLEVRAVVSAFGNVLISLHRLLAWTYSVLSNRAWPSRS